MKSTTTGKPSGYGRKLVFKTLAVRNPALDTSICCNIVLKIIKNWPLKMELIVHPIDSQLLS